MKKLYLIRSAKAGWDEPGLADFERGLSSRGLKNIRTIGAYLRLRGIRPDLLLSSCALRAQQTCDLLAEEIEYSGTKHYLRELYLTPPDRIREIITAQESEVEKLFVVGHSPQLHEVANSLMNEHLSRFPTMGIVAIDFEIDSWAELNEKSGQMDFFIYPKQFEYYMPAQIRAQLPREEL
ncbi:histidine phosphatase family protein [Nitratifractor sp.]|uniref:SixA phosphatase family protein n=1 Tax=Nitratifractor sp. TaxID=2268144 RepID=UPI0025E08EAD|nr:histidine phosphatase family protein [Nitratifractor sp.]